MSSRTSSRTSTRTPRRILAIALAGAVLALPWGAPAAADPEPSPERPDDFGTHPVPYVATGPWWSTDPALPADAVAVTGRVPAARVAAVRPGSVTFGRWVLVRQPARRVHLEHLLLTWRFDDLPARAADRRGRVRQRVVARLVTADGTVLRLATAMHRPGVVLRSSATGERRPCGRAFVDAGAGTVQQKVPLACLGSARAAARVTVAARVDTAHGRAVAGPYEVGALTW